MFDRDVCNRSGPVPCRVHQRLLDDPESHRIGDRVNLCRVAGADQHDRHTRPAQVRNELIQAREADNRFPLRADAVCAEQIQQLLDLGEHRARGTADGVQRTSGFVRVVLQ